MVDIKTEIQKVNNRPARVRNYFIEFEELIIVALFLISLISLIHTDVNSIKLVGPIIFIFLLILVYNKIYLKEKSDVRRTK